MKAKVQYKFLGYNLTSDQCKHINMFKIFECVHNVQQNQKSYISLLQKKFRELICAFYL